MKLHNMIWFYLLLFCHKVSSTKIEEFFHTDIFRDGYKKVMNYENLRYMKLHFGTVISFSKRIFWCQIRYTSLFLLLSFLEPLFLRFGTRNLNFPLFWKCFFMALLVNYETILETACAHFLMIWNSLETSKNRGTIG